MRSWCSVVLTAALSSGLSTQGWAQDSDDSATESMDSSAAESAPATSGNEDFFGGSDISNPSERARQGKMGGVALRTGFIVGALPGQGIDAFYHINRNLQVGIFYAMGTLNLEPILDDDPDVKVDKFEMGSSLALVQARYFFGNSFYVGGGLGQRVVEAEYDLKSKEVDARAKGEIKSTSTVATITIGNTWSWDSGFFIGADWIGYALPLSSSDSASTKLSGTAAPTDELAEMQEDSIDLAEDIGKTASPIALIFNIGYAF